jgi:hypothetical protein
MTKENIPTENSRELIKSPAELILADIAAKASNFDQE